jgi:UDP-N-acetylmuramate dehydrogenase
MFKALNPFFMNNPTAVREFKKRLIQTEIPFDENVDLAPFTSVGIGERIAFCVRPHTEGQLNLLSPLLKKYELPYLIHGQGTNCFFHLPKNPYPGVLIQWTTRSSHIESVKTNKSAEFFVKVHTGLRKATLSRFCFTHQYEAAVWLAGIPGTVGGGIAMNAGTRLGDFSTLIYDVNRFDMTSGTITTLRPHLCDFLYRGQSFCNNNQLLTSATLRLTKSENIDSFKKKFQESLAYRKKTQPLKEKSFGSTFKNPEGNSAGALIQALGLKGTHRGDAIISPHHANFFINRDKASGGDMLALIDQTQETVFRKTGISLTPEVRPIQSFVL